MQLCCSHFKTAKFCSYFAELRRNMRSHVLSFLWAGVFLQSLFTAEPAPASLDSQDGPQETSGPPDGFGPPPMDGNGPPPPPPDMDQQQMGNNFRPPPPPEMNQQMGGFRPRPPPPPHMGGRFHRPPPHFHPHHQGMIMCMDDHPRPPMDMEGGPMEMQGGPMDMQGGPMDMDMQDGPMNAQWDQYGAQPPSEDFFMDQQPQHPPPPPPDRYPPRSAGVRPAHRMGPPRMGPPNMRSSRQGRPGPGAFGAPGNWFDQQFGSMLRNGGPGGMRQGQFRGVRGDNFRFRPMGSQQSGRPGGAAHGGRPANQGPPGPPPPPPVTVTV